MARYSINQIIKYLLFLLLIFSFVFTVDAALPEYSLQGDELHYENEKSIVHGIGNVVFESTDLTVKSAEINVFYDQHLVRATGDQVVLLTDNQKIIGSSLVYNYQARTGTLYGAESLVDSMNFSGSKINIVADAEHQFEIEKAIMTPCRREDPHYYYQAGEVLIYPGDKVVAKDVTFRVKGIPIFYLPRQVMHYTEEGKLDSASPLVNVGYDNQSGFFVEFNHDYRLAASTGKLYYKSTSTDDEEILLNNIYQLNSRWNIKNEYHYNYTVDESEDDEIEEIKEYLLTVNYKHPLFSSYTSVGYDFLAEQRREKIGFNSSSFLDTNVSLYHDYLDEELDHEKYVFSRKFGPVGANLRYQTGYDYEYLPYLSLSFPTLYGVRTSLGTGKVKNGGVKTDKIKADLYWNNSFQLTEKWDFYLNEHLTAHYYDLPAYKKPYLTGQVRLGSSYNFALPAAMNLKTGFNWWTDIVENSSPLVDDRLEEETVFNPYLELKLPGEFKDAYTKLNFSGNYDLKTEDWDEINARITKVEDCFNFFVGYEFQEQKMTFGIEL